MLDEMTMKETYIAALANKMKENKNIVILEADLMSATGTKRIFDTWPDRSVNIGIAEANMIGVAAGLATFGKVPVCGSFAAWISRRDYDQICVSICYSGLNTKLIGLDPGIAIEKNGGTHTAFEDIPLFRALPGMTIVEPSDSIQLSQAIPQILDLPTPVYLRLYRKKAHTVHDGNYKFVLGKADVLREGGDVTIMAYGIMVYYARCRRPKSWDKRGSARAWQRYTPSNRLTQPVFSSRPKRPEGLSLSIVATISGDLAVRWQKPL